MSELPKNLKELCRHFPRKIPKAFCDEIDAKAKTNYIFCRSKEDKQKAVCSACGEDIIIPAYAGHNSECECPNCRRRLQVKHPWRGMKSLTQSVISYHYDKSRVDDDVITCTVVYSHYAYHSSEPWNDKPFRLVDADYVFIPGKGAVYAADKYKIYAHGFSKDNFVYYWGRNPYIRNTIRLREDNYKGMYGDMPGIDILEPSAFQLTKLVRTTSLKYCWEAYVNTIARWRNHDRFIKTLEFMCKYPRAMEYLAKIGLDETVYEDIQDHTHPRLNTVFNMRGKTLDKITRRKLTKADKRFLLNVRNQTGDLEQGEYDTISLAKIKMWQDAQKFNGGANISLRQIIMRMDYGFSSYNMGVLKYVKLDKLLKYLDTQQEKYKETHVDIGLYADYIRNCIKLDANMKSKATLWPKDLVTIHNNQKIEMAAMKHQKDETEYQKRKAKIKRKFTFEAMGFMIVVPDKVTDLVREGTDMHNCVGTYVERVAKGLTYVVYIRRVDAPGVSLGTMEISPKNNNIIQARGKFNKDLPAEVKKFIKAFEQAKLKRRKSA